MKILKPGTTRDIQLYPLDICNVGFNITFKKGIVWERFISRFIISYNVYKETGVNINMLIIFESNSFIKYH